MDDKPQKASSTPDPDGAGNDSEKERLSSPKIRNKPIARRGEGAFEDLGHLTRERRKASGSHLDDQLEVPQAEALPVAPRHQKKSTPVVARMPEDLSSEEIATAKKKAEARRPKNARASDFEPLTWASSQTRIDYSAGKSTGVLANLKAVGSQIPGQLKARVAKMNVLELSSLAVFALLSLAGMFLFLNLIGSTEAQTVNRALRAVNFPIKGELISVSKIEGFWRERRPENVAKARHSYLPEVQMTLTEGTGHLAVVFRDGLGIIQGDPARATIKNGKVESTGNNLLSVVCSSGFENEVELIWYQSNGGGAVLSPSWTVTLLESPDFNASLTEWKELLVFDMPGNRSKGDAK